MIKKELPFFFAVPAYVWQCMFLLAPICLIFYSSIVDYRLGESFYTLAHYKAILDWNHCVIIVRSLFLSCATMFSALICAYPVAYYLALRARRWKGFLLFLLTLPFWTNFLVLIYAWFFLLETNGIVNQSLIFLHILTEPLRFANSMFALFVVMVYCYLPFMIMPLYTILGKIDTRLFDASADLGATGWQTFSRVTLPLSLSGIKTGAFLVLIPVFGEFAIPALVGGQKYMLAGSMIRYYFFVVRDNGLGSAFTIYCIFALGLMAFLIFLFLQKCATFLYKRGSHG